LKTDVIIAGGGPAGSILAFDLAKNGISTVVLEKAHFPRYKPCGGGISLKAIKNIPFDIHPVIEKIPQGGILNFKGKRCFKVDLETDFAWLTMRAPFDAYLIEQAVGAGAQFFDGEPLLSFTETASEVKVKTPSREITGLYLVGADGVNSLVARTCRLLPHRQTGIALEAELSLSPSALKAFGNHATFDFGACPHGYGWYFPKRDHISAGVFCARPGKTPNLRQALQNHIQSQPVLRDAGVMHLQGHRIPLGGIRQTLNTRRVLLVGDAANLADPWLGEGVYYAVTSAHIAARTLQRSMEQSLPALSDYSRCINREMVKDISGARLFSMLVYSLPEFCSDLISYSPIMQKAVFGTIRGDINFRRLWFHLVLKSPLILFQALLKGIKNEN